MALWCKDFPVVTVKRGEPKGITLVTPYYDNPETLKSQVERWESYPPSLKEHFRAIVIDDGSQEHPIDKVILPQPRVRLFRIEVDVRWNWLAARNIGLHHVTTEWVLVTDIDHVLPESTLAALVYGKHCKKCVYGFSRREHTGHVVAPHSASFFMTKDMFWKIGGYDEALSGYYGTDGVFRREMAKHAKIKILTDSLIRYEYVGDSSTSKYKRKQPEDAAVSRIVAARPKDWKPRVLSYPYHELCGTVEPYDLIRRSMTGREDVS